MEENTTPNRARLGTLKARRTALGISIKDMSAIAGAKERTLKFWEAGLSPVPEDVTKFLDYASNQFRKAVSETLRIIEHTPGLCDDPGAILILPCPQYPDDYQKRPLYALPHSAFIALMGRLVDECRTIKIRALVVWEEEGTPLPGGPGVYYWTHEQGKIKIIPASTS